MAGVVYSGRSSCLCAHFAVFILCMHSIEAVCRCETTKSAKGKVRIWGRAPVNAQMDETVVLTSTGKGAACSKVFATHLGSIRQPVDDVPQVPCQPPASSFHTPGNKVAQFPVVFPPPPPPFPQNMHPCCPANLSSCGPLTCQCFIQRAIILARCHANITSPVHPRDWANGQLSRVPMTGRERARITADGKDTLATHLTDLHAFPVVHVSAVVV